MKGYLITSIVIWAITLIGCFQMGVGGIMPGVISIGMIGWAIFLLSRKEG